VTLINATLLFGALAAVIPLALHLMSRQDPKRVVLPSVRFLTQQLATQSSRLRVRRWWLLFLRMLILALIAAVLAGPVIGSAAVVSWATVAGLALAGIGIAAMASVAWVRGLARSLAWGLAAASVLAILVSIFFSARLWTSSEAISLAQSAPIAAVVLIDNSPTTTRTIESSSNQSDRGNRFDLIRAAAQQVIDRLPAGSRVAVTDRSTVPMSFALDDGTARDRINQLQPIAVPMPIGDRLDAAAELLRSSDLPDRQIIIVSDMSQPAWDPLPSVLPAWLQRTSADETNADADPIGLSIVEAISKDAATSAINRTIGPPRLIDVPPASGVPIPVIATVSVEAAAEARDPLNITVDLSLFERDPGLPVIRDGKTVLPALRSVDRTSVSVAPGGQSEITLTLPPLELGTHHAVMRIIGDDAMAWDDVRYLTFTIPSPRRVLVAGESLDEANILSAAVTAPRSVDDPAASYQIDRIGLQDLAVVSLLDYDVVVLIDPPIGQIGQPTLQSLQSFAQSGGGLWSLLGPSATASDLPTWLSPGLVRSWRVPQPGTFLEILSPSHPAFGPLNQLSERPPWGDFRIRRYWQTEPQLDEALPNDADDRWTSLARYAGTDHAAILVREKVLVTTTPLPALAGNRRDWNDLLSASDPWPAFILTRGIMGWLSGVSERQLTVTAGQTVTVSTDATNLQGTEPLQLQLFAPEENAVQPVTASQENILLSQTTQPGTYFLRGNGVWSGYSVNLADKWSVGKPIDAPEIAKWLGEEGWQSVADVEQLTFSSTSGRQSVPLHGPLMLLSVFVFLGELLLSNHFYRGDGVGAD
jgi:hypothetical protein